MAQFLGDIAFLLAAAATAAGFVLLHRASAVASGGLIRLAAYILVIGGIGTGLCTGYFWLQYYTQGDFHAAYPAHAQVDRDRPGSMGHHAP